MNRFHGGAIEECARTIRYVLSRAGEKNIGFADAAAQIVSESRQRGERIAGFGRVLHPLDPRTSRLFELAGEAGCRGKHVQVCEQIAAALEKQSGRKLPINVDGAIAAVLLELQIEPDVMNGFFMMARLPGLLAHAREEATREKPLRAVVNCVPSYDGPPRRDVPRHATGGD
jgi:citrate synthase